MKCFTSGVHIGLEGNFQGCFIWLLRPVNPFCRQDEHRACVMRPQLELFFAEAPFRA
jgi:hypothetical protein